MGIVELLVPEELWELFQRVVPEVPDWTRCAIDSVNMRALKKGI
ncbi:hypothetical protein [Streptomyces sp. NPDC017993]